MYKPFTVELYLVHQYLKQHFELEHFLLIPLSSCSVLLKDEQGDQIAFTCEYPQVRQIDVPKILTQEEVRAYIRSLRGLPGILHLRNFDDVTKWWLRHENPLTYQQALGLKDELFRHFMTHKLLDLEDVIRLVSQDVVTESEYNDILLWYLNGNTRGCWLGPYGVDGTGDSYKLVLNYDKPTAQDFIFYIKNEYYCFMNHLPYPYS